MPELPEVETIRRQLLPYLPMHVTAVALSKVVGSILKTRTCSLAESTLLHIERKGKLLHFIFDGDRHMISGLGMSGGWRIGAEKIIEKHTHIQFKGNNAQGAVYLAYVDPRRFGKCHWVDGVAAEQHLSKLGVDISSRRFTAAYVRKMCEKYPNREMKPFLLDQSVFAGVGNYIACEALAHGGILPARLAHTLSAKEHGALEKGTRLVLSGALKRRGLTFSGGYTDATGQKGEALSNLVVFHQEICGLCETTKVEKVILKGRGTYFCPRCQK